MPDPFGGQGTAADAAKIRARLDQTRQAALDLFGVPPTSVAGDPERRQLAEREIAHGAELTALAAAVTLTIPGRLGRLASGLLVGAERDPNTGSIRTGKSAVGNLAPAPIGYVDPKAYGLRPNFYLPADASFLVPKPVERIGFGLPQQAADDQRLLREAGERERNARTAQADAAVRDLSDTDLQQIISRNPPFLSRASRTVAFSGAGFDDLIAAARYELLRRHPPGDPAHGFNAPKAAADGTPEPIASAQANDRLLAANPPDP